MKNIILVMAMSIFVHAEAHAAAAALTNKTAWDIYAKYVEGWKPVADDVREKIAREIMTEDIKYVTPNHESGNRSTVIGDMAAFQKKFPGGRFDIGDVSAHHDVALLTWILVKPDGSVAAKGHDQIKVSPAGKIVELVTYSPSATKP